MFFVKEIFISLFNLIGTIIDNIYDQILILYVHRFLGKEFA